MNNENLLTLTSEQAREFGKKGGLVSSDRKKYAAKLRELKKRVRKGQLKSNDEEWLLTRIMDPDASALQILSLLDEVKIDDLSMDPEIRIKLVNAYTKAHTLIHGHKVKSENTNLNLNVTINADIQAAYDQIKGGKVIDVTGEVVENE